MSALPSKTSSRFHCAIVRALSEACESQREIHYQLVLADLSQESLAQTFDVCSDM